MKNFLLIVLFTVLSNGIYAQLKVLSNGHLQGGESVGTLKIETTQGATLQIAPLNLDFCHILTDRLRYYFNTQIIINGGLLKSYGNSDFRIYAGHSNYGTAHIWVKKLNGNVGIGLEPSYKLDVAGDIAINGQVRISSDSRLKKDIKDIQKNKVSKLYDLNGKTYHKEKKVEHDRTMMLSDSTSLPIPEEPEDTTTHIGFIAQELQTFFPELVKEDNKGYLSIDYVSLIPLLVEALKEQNDRITQLEEEKKQGAKLKSAESGNGFNGGASFLGQNSPNPFSEITKVVYFIPTGISKAAFYIYNMQGKQIKSVNLVEREYGSITISANELQPGIYLYSIVADG